MSSPVLAVAAAFVLVNATMAAEQGVAKEPTQPAAPTKLSSLLPKYSPPKPVSAVDRREVDRPRNTIIRLPKDVLPPEPQISLPTLAENEPAGEGVVRLPRYDVREDRLPNFKERELLSPTARVDLYMKRHPGLRIGNLFGLNRGIAAAMIAEADASDRRREMAELVSFQAFAQSLPRARDDRESEADRGTSTADATPK